MAAPTVSETDGDRKENQEDPYHKTIGEIGRWQVFVFLLTAFPIKMVLPNLHLAIMFMAPKTVYRCLERENGTEEMANMTCYADCKKYQYISDFEGTITEQWSLICDRAWIADFSQTICMFGTLVGNVIFGYLSDRHGRRITLIISGIMEAAVSFILPFCPELWSFIIMRFLTGIATGGTMITAFILLIEIYGRTKRDLLSVVFMFPLAAGILLMNGFALYFRNWRGVGVALATPTLIYLTYIFYLPESPKWLISVGRLEEAVVVMKSAAKWNNLPTNNIEAIVEDIAREQASKKKLERKATLTDLVTLPSLRQKTLCCCLMWFTGGLMLYGSNQYFGQTSSNVCLTFIIVALVQLVACLVAGYLSNAMGRRVSCITLFIISAIGTGLLALPDEWHYSKLIAGITGVSSTSSVFIPIYVFTTELFPTVARNMGMGASSTANKLGSMVAPFIGGLRVNTPWLPPALFALIPFIGAAACYFLPETRGKKLEDHLEDD